MSRSRSAAATVRSAFVALGLSIGTAHAQVAAGGTPPPALPSTLASTASPVFGLVQGLVGLVIVLGMIFAAGWLLKKLGPRMRQGGVVQVMGGASVGPREKVVVVRFGGQTLLLGVAPGQVTLLQAGDTIEAVDGTPQASASPRFVDRLRAARSGSR